MFFTIPNFAERMLEEPLSALTVLSLSAIITTIALFFCGIPICMQIYRRRSTNDISGFPFIMGFLGGSFWLRYGILKTDLTMVTVNVVGVSLMFLYMFFYLYFSRPRTSFLLQMLSASSVIITMLVMVHFYQMESRDILGTVCMTLNIINFGAPLAGMTVVLRNRSCATLPLPLCTANLLVSSQWCLYGVCVEDIYLIIPNAAGVLLAMVQISLFLVFPRKVGKHAPLARCCPCVMDLENGVGIGGIGIGTGGGIAGVRRRRGEKRANDPSAPSRALAARNKFLLNNRQRVIDRRMIPTSRAACIEYLRATGGGAFDSSFGSVSSRATADSWVSGASISRISSSLSHPELFAAIQQEDEAEQEMQMANGVANKGGEYCSTSTAAQSQMSVTVTGGPQPSEAILPLGDVVDVAADESQLLTEPNGGDLLFVRASSCTSGEMFGAYATPVDLRWLMNYVVIGIYVLIMVKLFWDGKEKRRGHFNRQPLLHTFTIIIAEQVCGQWIVSGVRAYVPLLFFGNQTELQIPLVYYAINCLSSFVNTSQFFIIYFTSTEHRKALVKEFPRFFRCLTVRKAAAQVAHHTNQSNDIAAIRAQAMANVHAPLR